MVGISNSHPERIRKFKLNEDDAEKFLFLGNHVILIDFQIIFYLFNQLFIIILDGKKIYN